MTEEIEYKEGGLRIVKSITLTLIEEMIDGEKKSINNEIFIGTKDGTRFKTLFKVMKEMANE